MDLAYSLLFWEKKETHLDLGYEGAFSLCRMQTDLIAERDRHYDSASDPAAQLRKLPSAK